MATIFWSSKEKNPIITYSYVKRNEKFLRIMRISFPFRTV